MSGVTKTMDVRILKTREIVVQGATGVFPDVNSVLTVSDTKGHTRWTSDLTLDSVSLISATGSTGTLTYNGSTLLLNGTVISMGGGSGVTGAQGPTGQKGDTGMQGPTGSPASFPNGNAYSQYIYWKPSSSAWVPELTDKIHIGPSAGQTSQGSSAIAIGALAGQGVQGARSIAIGNFAALNNQANDSVAIGAFSATNGQGADSVAIGYKSGTNGINAQPANSIAINASSTELNNPTSGSLVINPIRNINNSGLVGKLLYDPTTSEIIYDNSIGGVGPTGPQGSTGPTGAQGPQGVIGPQGITGPDGSQGPQGVQGITGPDGPSSTNFNTYTGSPVILTPLNPNQFIFNGPGDNINAGDVNIVSITFQLSYVGTLGSHIVQLYTEDQYTNQTGFYSILESQIPNVFGTAGGPNPYVTVTYTRYSAVNDFATIGASIDPGSIVTSITVTPISIQWTRIATV